MIPLVLVVLIGLAAALGGGEEEPTETDEVAEAPATAGDETSGTTSDQNNEPESSDAESPPDTEASEPSSSGIGAVHETGSGGLTRLNSATPNAPPLNDFITPDPGSTFTRLDVEVCAGEGGQSANPLYWGAQLGDNRDVTAELGAQGYETVELAPGECLRGTIDVSVPDGQQLSSVYLTDGGFSEAARWNLDEQAVPVTGPLAPSQPADREAIGTTAETTNGTATAYAITPNAAPSNDFITPDPGSTFTRLDVEVCAGSSPLSTNPLYWYGITDTNRWIGAELGAQEFESGEIAAGQCRRGTVDVSVPDGESVVAVALTNTGLEQVAGWQR